MSYFNQTDQNIRDTFEGVYFSPVLNWSNQTDQNIRDAFEGVFFSPVLNWSMLALYTLGLVSCAFLGLISWFEQSGQAGPYRTVINQLVSKSLNQVNFPDDFPLVLFLLLRSFDCFRSFFAIWDLAFLVFVRFWALYQCQCAKLRHF